MFLRLSARLVLPKRKAQQQRYQDTDPIAIRPHFRGYRESLSSCPRPRPPAGSDVAGTTTRITPRTHLRSALDADAPPCCPRADRQSSRRRRAAAPRTSCGPQPPPSQRRTPDRLEPTSAAASSCGGPRRSRGGPDRTCGRGPSRVRPEADDEPSRADGSTRRRSMSRSASDLRLTGVDDSWIPARLRVPLATVTSACETAPSILAAWVGGSLARGTADDWSDIDLHVLVGDRDEFEIGITDWFAQMFPTVLADPIPGVPGGFLFVT